MAMDIAQALQDSRGNVARLPKGNSAPDSSAMSNTAVASTSVPVASTSCPPTLADNLVSALEMLLGDNQGQCQSHPRQPLPNLSSSTPLGFSVPEKIREKIWGNQFIDLGLLIANHQVADKFNISITNEQNSNPACRWCQICAQNKLKIFKNGHLHSLFSLPYIVHIIHWRHAS